MKLLSLLLVLRPQPVGEMTGDTRIEESIYRLVSTTGAAIGWITLGFRLGYDTLVVDPAIGVVEIPTSVSIIEDDESFYRSSQVHHFQPSQIAMMTTA